MYIKIHIKFVFQNYPIERNMNYLNNGIFQCSEKFSGAY